MEEKITLREYLYSLRFYILFVSLVFIGSVVLGYIGFMSEQLTEAFEKIQQLSGGLKDFTELYPSWITFLTFFIVIFLNNSFTCFCGAILVPLLGIVILLLLMYIVSIVGSFKSMVFKYPALILTAIFGLLFALLGLLMCGFPLFSAWLNGGVLGWVAHEEGLVVFLAIVSHGIFELPAYLLSMAIGLRLAWEVFKRKEKRQLKMRLGEGLRVYFILIVPLLIIAALIESGLIAIPLFLF
jgi:stage II sporulation protein M